MGGTADAMDMDNTSIGPSISMSAFSNDSAYDVPMHESNNVSLPIILNGKFFKIIKKVNDTVHQKLATGCIAACQFCPNRNELKGSLKITSNFVQHIKTKHPLVYNEYILEKQIKRRLSKQMRDEDVLRTYTEILGKEEEESHTDIMNETNLTLNDNSSSSFVDELSRVSTDSANIDNVDNETLPLIINGKYFKVIKHIRNTVHQKRAGGVIVACQFCPQRKLLKGSIKITSNFLQHLKAKHRFNYEEYLSERRIGRPEITAYEDENSKSNNSVLAIKADYTMWNESSRMSTNGERYESEEPDITYSIASSPGVPSPSFKDTPLILNGKYFKIIKEVCDTPYQKAIKAVIAVCQFCPNNYSIEGSLTMTSNLVQHLKILHLQQYEEYIAENRSQEVSIKGEPDEDIEIEIKKAKFNDDESSSSSSALSSVSNHSNLQNEGYNQSKFDEVLSEFFVDSHASSLIVENTSFLSLFNNNPWKVKTARQMIKFLNTKYARLIAVAKDRLKNVNHVCTTVDIWTCKNMSFFGYACHWIDSNLCRQSLALACRRFTERPTFEKIVDLINSINNDFGLVGGKLTCTIAENVGDLRNAFMEYGIKGSHRQRLDDDIEIVAISTSAKPHRCGSNTLSDMATFEFINIITSNEMIYALHESSFQRCTDIWDKCKRPETTYIMEILLSCSLITPKAGHWITLFDSLKQLLQQKQQLNDLCLALNVTKFHPTELKYLEEYCLLLEPIANALNFLKDENNMFYGYFLPTLVTTKVKIRKLYESAGRLSYLRDIARQMETAFVGKFQNFFELRPECQDAVVAAISCPAIKCKFLKPLNVTFDHLYAIFFQYAIDFERKANQYSMHTSSQVSSQHPYFDFDETPDGILEEDTTSVIKRYLNDEDCSLNCLNRYPVVKHLFMKYNTPLPSAVPVDGLFSLVGFSNRQKRNNLTDKHFEQCVIMKANKSG